MDSTTISLYSQTDGIVQQVVVQLEDNTSNTNLPQSYGSPCLSVKVRTLRHTPLGVPTDLQSVGKKGSTYEAGGFEIPLSHRYAGYYLGAGDNISLENKVVRSFFDGGLQIRRDA